MLMQPFAYNHRYTIYNVGIKVKLNNIFMKKIIIVLLAAIISVPAFSQLKFGLKAGGQTTTVPTYDISSGTSNITSIEEWQWGFHGGAFARISLAFLHIQPEVVFVSNTFDYSVKEGTVPSVPKSQTFNRLAIPILLGIKLGPIRVNAGPAAAIQIGTPEALIDDPNFEDMYKGSLWGYQAGLGIDLFSKLTLDARFAGGLGDMLGDQVTIGGQTFNLDYSQTTFMLSVGWMF
jgi:Outer membrane protein beta-barrel domain